MSAVNHTRERRGANSVLYLVRETVCGSRSSMSISRMAEVCTNQASAIVMRKKLLMKSNATIVVYNELMVKSN